MFIFQRSWGVYLLAVIITNYFYVLSVSALIKTSSSMFSETPCIFAAAHTPRRLHRPRRQLPLLVEQEGVQGAQEVVQGEQEGVQGAQEVVQGDQEVVQGDQEEKKGDKGEGRHFQRPAFKCYLFFTACCWFCFLT